MEKFYITTPIYYPSGKFHIGTAYTTILTDTIARYKRQRGFDVKFLTGMDEHGLKIQTKAMEANIPPQEYVDIMADGAQKLWDLLEISEHDFIRTTDEHHEKIVKKICEKFIANDDIYLGKYEGWYCRPCETYFTETQLVDGKCPDCNREVELTEEECYFFKMSKYADRLIKFYEEHPHFLQPEYRVTELMNNFIKPGLEDLCISRTTFDWGIKMPNDPKHVLYVWVDALSNYITNLNYLTDDDSDFKHYWPANIQIIGKDIIRFHAIYWPIFLMALDIPLPNKIYAHGFIMMKEGKMSKSKGNVIYPEDLANEYGVDALKYFLLSNMNFGIDSVFTPERFVEVYNTSLCNDLGNLLNRTIGMANKYLNGSVTKNDYQDEFSIELENIVKNSIKEFEINMEKPDISGSLANLFEIISKSNKYIDLTTPWALFKDNQIKELNNVLYHLIENLRIFGILITPFMPNLPDKIFEQLNIPTDLRTIDSIKEYGLLKETTVISEGHPLFMRLEEEKEIEKIKSMMN